MNGMQWTPEEIEKERKLAAIAERYGFRKAEGGYKPPAGCPIDVIDNRAEVEVAGYDGMNRKAVQARLEAAGIIPTAEEQARQERAPEYPKRVWKPDRHENELMLNLMILRNGLMKYSGDIRERCQAAGPTVWRDLRAMLALLQKVQDALLETMPERRKEYYENYRRYARYIMEIQKPVQPVHQMIITDVLAGALAEAAMENECLLCARSGKEVDKCLVREAMLEVAPPTVIADTGSIFAECEYHEAARALTRGDNVTV